MSNRKIQQELRRKQQELAVIIHNAEKEIRKSPPGSVEVRKHGNSVQFYYRSNSPKKNGEYMRTTERSRAISLINKRYQSRILIEAQKQKNAIDRFLSKYDPDALEKVYRKEGPTRQSLISPVVLPDKEYLESWQAIEYQGKEFREDSPVFYTQRHERVRSKSEVMIADALFHAKIPYRYEYPLKLGNITVYPDFTILRLQERKLTFWEHLGMIDDPEYRNTSLLKIRQYEAFGIFPGDKLILTMELFKMPLTPQTIQNMIRHYLLDTAA